MGTKIKVSTEIESGLETVKRGDVVRSIYFGGLVLVVRTANGGKTFDGLVLFKGTYTDHEVNDFVHDLSAKNFEPFVGTITLDCE